MDEDDDDNELLQDVTATGYDESVLELLAADLAEQSVDDPFALASASSAGSLGLPAVQRSSAVAVQLRRAMEDEPVFVAFLKKDRAAAGVCFAAWKLLMEMLARGTAAATAAAEALNAVTDQPDAHMFVLRDVLLAAADEPDKVEAALERVEAVLADPLMRYEAKEKDEYSTPQTLLLVGQGSPSLVGRVVTDAGCFVLATESNVTAAGVVATYIAGEPASFVELQGLIDNEKRTILVVALQKTGANALPDAAEREWCAERGAMGPAALPLGSAPPAAVAAALLPLASRVCVASERVPLAAVAGGVQAVTGSEVSTLQCVLPGGVFVCRRQGSGTVVCPLSGYHFVSSMTCKAVASSPGGRGLLSFQVGDAIHILSTSLGKKRWFGYANGKTGMLPMRLTDAGVAPPLPAVGPPSGNNTPSMVRRRIARLPAVENAPTPSGAAASANVASTAAPEAATVLPLMTESSESQNFNDLVRIMVSSGRFERGQKRKAKNKKLKKPLLQCWEGQDGVAWLHRHLLEHEAAATRGDAVRAMQQLLDENFIYNAVDMSVTKFEDDTDLWRFWCDGPAPPLNVRCGLVRRAAVRPAAPVARMLLETAVSLLRPFVKLTGGAGIELDYYRLRELRRWSEFETGVCELQRVALDDLAHESERTAFWINVHNLLAVQSSVCNKGLVAGGWKGGFFTDSCYMFGGCQLSLFQIHSGLLRQNSTLNPIGVVPLEPGDPMLAHVLPKPDPRVLFALSGCFRDSPAVRFVDGPSLGSFLNAACADYLDEYVSVDLTNCVVTLPGLMYPFLRDFGKDFASVLVWVSKYLPANESKRQLVTFLAQQSSTQVKFTEIAFDVFPPKI